MKDYKFGQKNNWRRAIWNEIVKRLKADGTSTKDALILYLAGEQDLDRKVAIEKGFNSDNLIAVEKNKNTVKKLRKEGKIVISGDFKYVLAAWKGTDVDIIYADFCCGLEPSLGIVDDCLSRNRSLLNAVILINLQRGRDAKGSASIKKITESWMKDEYQKHRSVFFLTMRTIVGWNYMYHRARTEELLENEAARSKSFVEVPLLLPKKDRDWDIFWNIFKSYNPKFFSYQSGGRLFMDSAVFESPFKRIAKEEGEKYWKRIEDLEDEEFNKKSFWKTGKKIELAKKQINAALAIRTMKLRGKLRHSPQQ